MTMVHVPAVDVVFSRRLVRAARDGGAAQVLADELWLRLRIPALVLVRDEAGWRVRAVAGPLPSVAWSAPATGAARWLARVTMYQTWRRLHVRGAREARVLVGGHGAEAAMRALCRLAAPHLGTPPAPAHNQQLAQDMAQFVHDFEQPLATLTLSLQLMQPTLAQEEHARRCLRSVEQQRELLHDLLLLVAGESAPAAPVALEALAVDVLADARAQADARQVTLRLEQRAAAVLVGARTALRRALANVVLNAVQMTPLGSTVTMQLKRAKRGIAVEVRDQGPGLPPGKRERVFAPFVSERQGGTGLGLAIARAVTAAHGGTVQFVDGDGGRVRFVFPRAQIRRD